MVYAHQVVRNRGHEPALLRHHPSEDNFGVQIAASKPKLAAQAAVMAEQCGATFVDLNCGCPIHDTVRKGMGARLLQKIPKLGRILEAMVEAVSIPVTVKLRTGFTEEKINIRETIKVSIEAGVQTITIHGRTREQRYSRSADWDLLAELAAEFDIPILGNGDILTPYEAADRLSETRLAGAMIARGALTKPWIFRELETQTEWLPNAQELWEIAVRFCEYLKEHFGIDELGRRRGTDFLAWHLDWFGRYRALPQAQWGEHAKEHPLLQTRETGEPLLYLPSKAQVEERLELAYALWDSPRPLDMWEELLSPSEAQMTEVSSGR